MIPLTGTDPNQDAYGIRTFCLERLRPTQLERLNTLVQQYPTLRSGELYFRPTSVDGVEFVFPKQNKEQQDTVLAWSRIAEGQEFLCAINSSEKRPAVVYVTVDDSMHPVDSAMQCFFASDLSPAELNVEVRNGKSIRLTIPPGGLVIYG